MVVRKPTKRENVSLPLGLLRTVDKAVSQSDLFTSRARFIEEATKEYLYKLIDRKIIMYGINREKES